jgi:hypothetical protein
MALKKFIVIYNRQLGTSNIPSRTITKAEAEKLHGKLGSTEANAVVIPQQEIGEGKIIKLEAESAEGAAIAVRLLIGSERDTEPLVAEEANLAVTKQD